MKTQSKGPCLDIFPWNIPNKTAGQQPQWQHLLGTIIACQWSTTMCQRTMSSTTQSESASKTFTPVPKTTTAQEAAIWGVSKAGSWTCKTSSQPSHEHEHTSCQVIGIMSIYHHFKQLSNPSYQLTWRHHNLIQMWAWIFEYTHFLLLFFYIESFKILSN